MARFSFASARRLAPAVALALTIGVGAAHAHDFWLVPDAFAVAPGRELAIRGQTSSAFPSSLSAVTVDRIADARVLAAEADEPIRTLSTAGTSLRLAHRPRAAGQRVVVVALKPRSVRDAAAAFRRYMELEGAPELAERYAREGLLPQSDSITRRYAKYAKTVVEVGRGGPRAFERTAGHPLELVPLADPSALRRGDSLPVRLLFRGSALAGAYLAAGTAPAARASAAGPLATAEPRDSRVRTDAEGIARIPLPETGLWNVRTIHIVPAEAGSGADWDVHWSTLVFRVAR